MTVADANDLLQNFQGIDRSEAVANILRLLGNSTHHVHLCGPPGFGKRDAIRGLVQALPERAVVVRLGATVSVSDSPLKGIADELAGYQLPMLDWPTDDWAAGWAHIASIARDRASGRPLLILDAVEVLFDAYQSQSLPDSVFDDLDLVTVSVAPLILLTGTLPEDKARRITVELLSFPEAANEEDGYGDFTASEGRRNTQSPDMYDREGEAWFRRYVDRHPSNENIHTRLKLVFSTKHKARRDDIWDGHPLLNLLILERMLDAVRTDVSVRAILENLKADLGSLRGRASTLRDRLVPFEIRAASSLSPTIIMSVCTALIEFAKGNMLDARQREWACCSGLVWPMGGDSALEWTKVATLLTAEPGTETGRNEIRRWAERQRMAARDLQRRIEDARASKDRGFQAAIDQVRRTFCQTDLGYALKRQIETGLGTRTIVPGQMYSIELSYQPDDANRQRPSRSGDSPYRVRSRLLVFETHSQGVPFWRHHVRVLSMLGRTRHPALPAYQRGGILRPDGEDGCGELAYIEINDPREGEPVTPETVRTMLETLRHSSPDDSPNETIRRVFGQIVSLAEALDLIHAQGLLHRALNFDALTASGQGTQTQLTITGFEYALNLRTLFQHKCISDATIWRVAPWNLSCRAPEAASINDAVIDPAVDVYAFGALATMLMTGLPGDSVLAEVDQLLPVSLEQNGTQGATDESKAWRTAATMLRADLLRADRWTVGNEHIDMLRTLLASCLETAPGQRPTMEQTASKLRWAYQEYVQYSMPDTGVLRVSYDDNEMSKKLKNFRLIDEDQDVDSEEGRGWLLNKIQEWVNISRWMHYREEGFPKQGKSEAESLRRNSKYILAGPAVVFFAAPYMPPNAREPTWDLLWLSYAMPRHDIYLPDPSDEQFSANRATTEDTSWIQRPKNIIVVPRHSIAGLQDITSWESTRKELEIVGRLDARRRQGREAATVWRFHRDILLAKDDLERFPVKLQRDSSGQDYVMELDVDRFRLRNEQGPHSFLRQIILEERNPRAFFQDTVAAKAEEAHGQGITFRIVPQASGNAQQRSLNAMVLVPVDTTIRIRLENAPTGQVPRDATIIWHDSLGTQVASRRQSQAMTRLERKSWLMDYLVNPRDCGKLLPPVSSECAAILDATKDQVDKLKDQVQVMLGSDPLHAVQGPPGTGKTTLISALVDEVVRAQDGARMLVTSQSHAATDNVMLAVMSALDKAAERDGRSKASTGTAIRLFSEQTEDSVDPEVRRRYSIDAQVREAQARMRQNCREYTARPGTAQEKALKHLIKAADTGYLEIRSKIERSAPLVFSTTGAAMTAAEYLRRGAFAFDYALIDEAAKAWAVDLIQPMSLADRAILVGDQAQLPPFGEVEIDRLLENAQRRRDGFFRTPPDIDFLLNTARTGTTGKSAFERMKGWLKLFHRLFDDRQPERQQAAGQDGIPLTQSLNRQFRSVNAIGRIVSETFYNKHIESHGPESDPRRRLSIPIGSQGRTYAPAVVWIDTSDIGDSKYFSRHTGSGAMRNEGEAKIVSRLLKHHLTAGNSLHGDLSSQLKILSPYKAQVKALWDECNLHFLNARISNTDAERLFQTVDASQGSEADIVIISVCRRMQNLQPPSIHALSPEEQHEKLRQWIHSAMGFLQQPERLNVMMSRARQQIIIIGSFKYYKTCIDIISASNNIIKSTNNLIKIPTFWEILLNSFEEFDHNIRDIQYKLDTPTIIPVSAISE